MKKRSPNVSSSRNRMLTASRRGVTPRSGSRARAAAPKRAAAKPGLRGQSVKITTDHEQIRRWVEARGGHPATVKRTSKDRQAAGVIRIDFPGFSGAQSLKPISWDEWFEMFEERQLGFLYQDRTASGKQSRFNKLVNRREAAQKRRGANRKSSSRARAGKGR